VIRTFLDSGVLIAAARAVDREGERAIQLLEEPNRLFLTSPLVQPPKAIHRSSLVKVVYLFS